jgi:uncharacterized protein YkwD
LQRLTRTLVGYCALLAAGHMHASLSLAAEARFALQGLHLADCGLAAADMANRRSSGLLDAAAARWARGAVLREAVARSGYSAKAISGLHVYGADARSPAPLGAASCRVLRDRSLRELGVYSRGADRWLVFATPAALPGPADAAANSRQALQLVNAARQAGQRCGRRDWPPAPALRLSAPLAAVAGQHARDMAAHQYFEHQDRAGRSPADRLRAAGYQERIVGENIAYGPLSTTEVISGWLRSAEHCENLLDPRYKEMGIAYAVGRGSQRGLYWVQLFAAPR